MLTNLVVIFAHCLILARVKFCQHRAIGNDCIVP